MPLRYVFQIGGIPLSIPLPQQRLEEAERLKAKYLEPKVEVEKIALKFDPKDWLPYILGICGFILLLRLMK